MQSSRSSCHTGVERRTMTSLLILLSEWEPTIPSLAPPFVVSVSLNTIAYSQSMQVSIQRYNESYILWITRHDPNRWFSSSWMAGVLDPQMQEMPSHKRTFPTFASSPLHTRTHNSPPPEKLFASHLAEMAPQK